jgi:hypothetical protein
MPAGIAELYYVIMFQYGRAMWLGRFFLRLRRPAATLAAFAVLLQLAVAATHHHAERVPGEPFASGSQHPSAFAKQVGHDEIPPADGGDCQICLGIALGALFLLPAAIQLGLLRLARDTFVWFSHAAAGRTLAFQSRAPPCRL